MALLYYQNLDVRRSDILMKNAFFGLKTFYDFLRRTKDYMESDAAVKRLAWKPGFAPDDNDSSTMTGVWVQLEEPQDRPNEPESTFRAFMDENVREVFEVPLDEDRVETPNRRRNGWHKFLGDRKIVVLDRDPETWQLFLERRPNSNQLLLRPNTFTIHCQIKAIQTLQNTPSSSHLPLLRLMESLDHAQWPSFVPSHINNDDWMILRNEQRPGTDEQRRFVELAMATPDFMFLEGPPGSGKTTAICELVLQLAKEGKRAILCASTHVAVDNVLERLMDERNPHRDLIIPVRIGERRNISEKARPWQLEQFIKTERERLFREIERRRNLSESQKSLLSAIRHGSTAIERMVLDASNLVCGTTIGILQHPDIKASDNISAAFDVLIVDEASKTTFQEFLVPALRAKRWVIVGDPKQLSPYVEDAAMAVNVEACIADDVVRNACVDVFMAGHSDQKKRRVAVVTTDSSKVSNIYMAQSVARKIDVAKASDSKDVSLAALVVGNLADIEQRLDNLPLDAVTVRAPETSLDRLRRRTEAWLRLSDREREEQPEWAIEIAWRLIRLYEQRFTKETESQDRHPSRSEQLREKIEELLPAPETGVHPDDVLSEIDRVRRVAFPSIIESLRYGFERDLKAKKESAISNGLPEHVLAQRHVLLSTQHRMHPDIAAFSHANIYDGKALITPDYMSEERSWSFNHGPRAVWLDVRGKFNRRFNSNRDEANAVIEELRRFDKWAEKNPRDDGRPWEAAVLTLYRGQEREVRFRLRQWTMQNNATRHFTRGSRRRPHLTIELCTVDRFQGHEADLVTITIANDHPTSFLESVNRLNVALTRARYQRVVVGNRNAMARAKTSVLGLFAETEAWDQPTGRTNS